MIGFVTSEDMARLCGTDMASFGIREMRTTCAITTIGAIRTLNLGLNHTKTAAIWHEEKDLRNELFVEMSGSLYRDRRGEYMHDNVDCCSRCLGHRNRSDYKGENANCRRPQPSHAGEQLTSCACPNTNGQSRGWHECGLGEQCLRDDAVCLRDWRLQRVTIVSGLSDRGDV
jgi:hypothetical protein